MGRKGIALRCHGNARAANQLFFSGVNKSPLRNRPCAILWMCSLLGSLMKILVFLSRPTAPPSVPSPHRARPAQVPQCRAVQSRVKSTAVCREVALPVLTDEDLETATAEVVVSLFGAGPRGAGVCAPDPDDVGSERQCYRCLSHVTMGPRPGLRVY